jgi:tryptophan-rich sensory protein
MTSRRQRSGIVSWATLGGFLLLTLAVGQFGAQVTRPALDPWYRALAKPGFTPPDIAFPIVWTALFVLMAVAAWLVWRASGWSRAAGAFALFAAQLALNGAWSFLFFGLQNPLYGLLDIAVLLPLIVATALAFTRHSRAAGWLFLPYVLWVAYAAALNFRIWQLNG